MLIGQFSESYPPVMDGVGEVVYDYVHELRRLGDDCYAIVSGGRGSLEYDKKVGDEKVLRSIMHVIPMISPYGYTKIRKEVKDKVASLDFDIVHAHSPFMMGRYAIKTARKKNIPIVMTFHSQFKKDIKRVVKSEFITNLVLKYVVHSFKMADYVWAVSDGAAKMLESYGFSGKVETVRNFCKFTLPSEEERLKLREEGRAYLKVDNGPVALFVGQQRKEKNLDLVLSAMKILKEEGFYCTLVSVGSGPDAEKYNRIADEYKIKDRVIFTGSIKDRDLLKRIYASSDLFTFPSTYDTAGLVIMEAASCSVPSLLIKNATCAEGTRKDENVFISEENPEKYAAEMKRIFSDDELRLKVGRNAQESIYRSKEDAARDVRARYEKIIKEYNAGH